MSKDNNWILAGLVALVIGLGGGFFWGFHHGREFERNQRVDIRGPGGFELDFPRGR